MFYGIIAVLSWFAFDGASAVVIDRIAVVVGKLAIKTSDIDRDLRLTAFLNRAPLVESADAKKKAADRLVDQQIIRQQIATGDYPRAADSDAAALLQQLRTDRFGGSDTRLRAELSRYGLTEAQLQEHLLWQLTVLRFIDERFRPGVQVSDDEVRKYYDQHLADLKRQYPKDFTFPALEPAIRQSLEGEQTNKQFEEWLDTAHQNIWIEYHPGALR